MLQTTGFSLVWMRWRLQWGLTAKSLATYIPTESSIRIHMCRWQFFSLSSILEASCVLFRSWMMILPELSNFLVTVLPQMSHLNGFFPEWTTMCFSNSALEMEPLLHRSHLELFTEMSFLWHFSTCFKKWQTHRSHFSFFIKFIVSCLLIAAVERFVINSAWKTAAILTAKTEFLQMSFIWIFFITNFALENFSVFNKFKCYAEI